MDLGTVVGEVLGEQLDQIVVDVRGEVVAGYRCGLVRVAGAVGTVAVACRRTADAGEDFFAGGRRWWWCGVHLWVSFHHWRKVCAGSSGRSRVSVQALPGPKGIFFGMSFRACTAVVWAAR